MERNDTNQNYHSYNYSGGYSNVRRRNSYADSMLKNRAVTQDLRGRREHYNFRPVLKRYSPSSNYGMRTGKQYWNVFREQEGCFSYNYNSRRNRDPKGQSQKKHGMLESGDCNTVREQNVHPNCEKSNTNAKNDIETYQAADVTLIKKTATCEDSTGISELNVSTSEASCDNAEPEISQTSLACEDDYLNIPLRDLLGDVNTDNWELMTEEEIKQLEGEYLGESEDSES
ncbi:uncharacterized protein TRIADDRAFT_51932 [Trichoplax adhaerens]|uniref:Uncharacterized protein n=1 Tax=Trichoplax adhaerens TaxID=10228 RepID=B3RL99_TRIAD|nr:predicted protein [Trichoplax adhaerens]EDV29508.1 predicted protein [Trichoplax adhaerens]|eukprot:XP_002108710.1 predicted protein [Trichoplax adhaerens]